MTLPLDAFRLVQPRDATAAVAARRETEGSTFLAGGTDLIANLRRGIGCPPALIDLSGIEELREIDCGETGTRIGAGVTLAALARSTTIRERHAAVAQAAESIAGPGHRNVATVGGNLCLDTRCLYYNQSEWWRRANGYCLKRGGEICHVAPQGARCHAAFSGDLAPALLALGAEVEIAGSGARRRSPLTDLYAEDGRAHLTLAPGELIVAVHLPSRSPASAYQKARVRAAMDFPVAGVAVALGLQSGAVTTLRVGITGTNSRPLLVEGLEPLLGRPLDESALAQLDKLVQKQVRPMRTTMISGNYRRLAAAALACRLAAQLAARETKA